jgi:hypothetical protein
MKENKEIPYLISEGRAWSSLLYFSDGLESLFLTKAEFEMRKDHIRNKTKTESGMNEFYNKYKELTDKIKNLHEEYMKKPLLLRIYDQFSFKKNLERGDYAGKIWAISRNMFGWMESNRLRASLTGEPIKEGYHNGLIELWALTKENMFLKEKHNKTNTKEYKELKEDFDYYDEMFNEEMEELEKTIENYLF